MNIVVQKFGGSSVATLDKLRQVAAIVTAKRKAGHDVVVVVSAMGDTTDELLGKAKEICSQPDRRELDMLLSVGERVSMSLLAMAIREAGLQAVSLTGSQSGIITTASHNNARIMEVRPFRVQDELERGCVVIVAGYQGVSYKRDITTLGRGGSDTTAVALAAALDASACEIYSDVAGVLTADPRVVEDATVIDEIGYQEMQEFAASGAKVLHAQAVEFAKQKGIAIYARKTASANPGTVVRKDVPSPSGARGIAHQTKLLCVTAHGRSLDDVKSFMTALEAEGAEPRQLHFESGLFSCVVSPDDVHRPERIAAIVETHLRGTLRDDLGAVSAIGDGILRDPRATTAAIDAAQSAGASIAGISTSSFRVTLMVAGSAVERTVRALHAVLIETP